MKPTFSNALHSIPWWGLIAGGVGLLVGLALFVTPFHFIELEKAGATPEENRAIKREVDMALGEGAIDIARGVMKEMRDRTRDESRREELDRALEEIDQARESIREAGAEVQRAKKEASQEAANSVREAKEAIIAAQKEIASAFKDSGADGEKLRKSLEDSLKAAEDAQHEAERAATSSKPPPRIVVMGPDGKKPLVDIDLGNASGPPLPPLPPEVRQEIRKNLTKDLYRLGVGSGLILIFIPLFILAVVSKFLIGRSRASQAMAEMKRKEADYHRMSQQVTEAKLSALQAQVEPHFLYNTLASVQALTEVDPARANAMTGHLIQYLRNALPKMRESVSTVGQEIELVRAYLNILQMRMGKRLSFEIDVPAELMDAPFPPLMLPSLVENAIKHGLEPQREGGMVRIGASAADGKLRMIVADTGRGFGETLGTGVGLTNIRERLAAMYGDGGKLTLEAQQPHGVVATIEVPRDGARVGGSPGAAAPAAEPAPPAGPQTATQKTLAVMGTAERAWRKGLTFTFFVLVIVAAVLAGLGVLGVMTGTLPVNFGEESMGGAAGAFIGTAGIAAGFAVVVMALAIVLAVVYGLGFLFVGLAIFIPLVVLVALFPVLAPFLLLGLGIWWLVRRNKAKKAPIELTDANRDPR
jgi:hypothetical protein